MERFIITTIQKSHTKFIFLQTNLLLLSKSGNASKVKDHFSYIISSCLNKTNHLLTNTYSKAISSLNRTSIFSQDSNGNGLNFQFSSKFIKSLTSKGNNYGETMCCINEPHSDLPISILIKNPPSIHLLSEFFIATIINYFPISILHSQFIRKLHQFERKKSPTYFCNLFISHLFPNASSSIHFNFIEKIASEAYSTVYLSTSERETSFNCKSKILLRL